MLLLPCVNYNLVCVCVLPHMTEVTVIKSGLKQLLLALFSLCIFLLRGSVGGTCVLEGVCVCVCVHAHRHASMCVCTLLCSVCDEETGKSFKQEAGDKWAHTDTHAGTFILSKSRKLIVLLLFRIFGVIL